MMNTEHIKKINQERIDTYNNSVGTLNEKDGIDCDVCKNKGYIETLTERGYIVTNDCHECHLKRKVYRTIKDSGLKEQFENKTFDNYITNTEWRKSAKEKAIKFTSENSHWFAIVGMFGSGKTMLCTAISKALIEKGYDFKWLSFASVMPYIQKEMNSGFVDVKNRAEEKWQEYKDVKVLYIDDFLKVDRFSVNLELVFDLIDYRYRNSDLITIISSEVIYSNMKNFDGAIASRIYERCNNGEYFINLIGDDKNYRENK